MPVRSPRGKRTDAAVADARGEKRQRRSRCAGRRNALPRARIKAPPQKHRRPTSNAADRERRKAPGGIIGATAPLVSHSFRNLILARALALWDALMRNFE